MERKLKSCDHDTWCHTNEYGQAQAAEDAPQPVGEHVYAHQANNSKLQTGHAIVRDFVQRGV